MKPRRTGYKHRDIIAVHNRTGVTEHGEVVTDLPAYALDHDTHVWVTMDPAWLLSVMLAAFTTIPAFNYQIVHSTEHVVRGAFVENGARLTRFGFKCRCDKDDRKAWGCACGCPPKRKGAMNTVWSPGDMSRNPGDYMDEFNHTGLLKFATDVRGWCDDQNLPLPTSLSGIAASLLRDSRFWPAARGRVPTATNERVRAWLPGVYSELRTEPGDTHHAVAIDQRTAYHRAAQEVATPDPTTLFARGYFLDPEHSPVWAEPETPVFTRTIAQPGVIFITYSARPVRKHEARSPAITPGTGRAAVWTNEVPHLESMGVTVTGIIAAWTSCDPDAGLPRYGHWAQARITESDGYRKRWLKPTLHAVYGLLAMRTRQVSIGHLRGSGQRDTFILGAGREFPVHRHDLPPLPSPTTNTTMLGVLQAEIRVRSFKMATALSMEGVKILHIHADGLHVEGALPLLTDAWSITPRTNLQYIDRVSWLSDEGDVLPGRDERKRVETRRHHARLIRHIQNRTHRPTPTKQG